MRKWIEEKMSWSDILKISFTTFGMFLVPVSIITLINKDTILDYIWRERLEPIELNDLSFETRKKAIYINKLIKVYELCKELDIDKGFYFDLIPKIKNEIEYTQKTFEQDVGKEFLEKINNKKSVKEDL